MDGSVPDAWDEGEVSHGSHRRQRRELEGAHDGVLAPLLGLSVPRT